MYIFIVVMPVLSTWAAPSPSQEDPTTPTPEYRSTTRQAGSEISHRYNRRDGPMAALNTIMRRKPR